MAQYRFYQASNIDGHYLGAYAVIVAANKAHALRVLLAQLKADKLPQKSPETIVIEEIDATKAGAVVLFNGDY